MLCMLEHVRCCVRGRFVCNRRTFALRNVFAVPSAKAHCAGPCTPPHMHIDPRKSDAACDPWPAIVWYPQAGLPRRRPVACASESETAAGLLLPNETRQAVPPSNSALQVQQPASRIETHHALDANRRARTWELFASSPWFSAMPREPPTGPTRAAHAVCPSREHHPRSVIRCYCVRCA